MRTFIRWQGNKSPHINKFIEYIPEFIGTYIEPFLGSGALFLKLQPKKWIINDINKDLINIWKFIKENPQEIINIFTEFGIYFKPLSKQDKIQYCREITSKIELKPYDITRACDYLLMKFCAYMNNIIISNTMVFRSLDLHILSRDKYYFLEQNSYNNINQVSQFLNISNGHIFNQSYQDILCKAKEGDFVFLDPPYIENHKYDFNYNKGEILDDLFLKELYNQVKKLDSKNIKWLMTQADTLQIKEIFKEYTIKSFSVYRSCSKKYVKELLIMNYVK